VLVATVIDDLFVSGIPLYEKALRTIAVYLAILILLRALGKRDLAQLNTLDLVVLLLLSNIVQNALIGSDNSLTGGLFGVVVLLASNQLLVALAWRFPWLERLVVGTETVLIENGKLSKPGLRHQFMRPEEVETAVRRQGGSSVEDVQRATLKPGGTIEIVLKPQDVNATRRDIGRLEQKLDQLLERAPT